MGSPTRPIQAATHQAPLGTADRRSFAHPNFLLLSVASRGMNGRAAATCRQGQFHMNASEKQTIDSPAGARARKTRVPKPAVKALIKSVARASKPKRGRKTTTARKGTNTAKILALLQRSNGASLKELRKATGWQAHSVRGFLSGAVKTKMGLRIDSVPRDDGERAYRVIRK